MATLGATSTTTTFPAAAPTTLFNHVTTVGNVTTTDTVLYDDTIAANQFVDNGDALVAEFSGVFIGHATATKLLTINLGSGPSTIFSSGTLSSITSDSAFNLRVRMTKAGTTNLRTITTLTYNGVTTVTSLQEFTGWSEFGSTAVLELKGQAGGVGAASDQIKLYEGYVDYKPNA